MPTDPANTLLAPAWRRYTLPIGYVLVVSLIRIALLHGSIDNTLINLDQFIVPVAFAAAWSLRLGKPAIFLTTFLVATVITGIDVLSTVHRVFRWEAGSAFDYLRASGSLPWLSVLVTLGTLLGMMIATVGIMTFAARERPVVWPLLAAVPVILVVDALLGVSRFTDIGHEYNIAVSPGLTAVINLPNLAERPARLVPFNGSTMARSIDVGHAPRQILSVAYESWGFARDRSVRGAIVQPLLRQLARNYRIVEDGSHAFRGATLAGETRELCSLQIGGVPKAEAAAGRLGSCLPARLAKAGYATEVFHGNGGEIYARDLIYPAMGFSKRHFYGDMAERTLSKRPCTKNVFLGLCDDIVFRHALASLDGRPRFVHVMTLDTHLPILRRPDDALAIRSGDVLLDAYVDAFRHSMDQLGRSIEDATAKPDRIFLYGDHTPPFFSLEERERFVPGRVPFMVLDRVK